MFNIADGIIKLTNRSLKNKELEISKRDQDKIKNIEKIHDSKIVKTRGKYYLALAILNPTNSDFKTGKFIGIDPGIRTYLSCFSDDHSLDFDFNEKITNALDKLKELIKNRKKIRWKTKEIHQTSSPKKKNKRTRKKSLTKIERRKDNAIDQAHWQAILYLIKNYDYIMLEKFNSQGFVKGGKNKNLNRRTNNLKPFLFRQRLLYKAKQYNKHVTIVEAFNTTKTCSSCGNIQHVGLDKVYKCKNCGLVLCRDKNASKNMKMKGILPYELALLI
jgi:putative transposase